MHMRKTSWIALAALFVTPAVLHAQQKAQQPASAQSSQSPQASPNDASSAQEDPLAAAARKAREEHKNAPKPAKVFTNDNLPTEGGISTVGEVSAPEKGEKAKGAAAPASSAATPEAQWRTKFADLRKKLQQDQSDLATLQHQLSQQMLQFYNGDPQKAVEDQESGHPLGAEYDKTKAKIEAKQKQVDADQQAISDAEDALRQAGGDPGWAR
jgi:hypothetical protein